MPSKQQNLHSELKRILAASSLRFEDQRLVLTWAKKNLAELHQSIKIQVGRYYWSRYRKASPKELRGLLWQDAEALKRKERKAATHHDKLRFRRQARILEDISAWFSEHQDGDKYFQQLLAGSEEDQRLAGRKIDGLINLCMRAARNGLLKHPYINKLVAIQRLTYNKPVLRKAQMGLESHLPKPIEARQLEIEEMRGRGLSLQQIATRLENLDLNPAGKPLGKKAIHKRLKRSGPK